ncbi:hypothetical protein Dimus_016641 [Dionaea muscipula]
MEYSNNNEPWEWQGEDYDLQKDSNLGISENMWGGSVTRNEEDLSYMFDETTPIKDCGDLYYHAIDSGNMKKANETSLQVKRRRMLQFSNEALDPIHSEDISSSFLKSKERTDSMDDVPLDLPEWDSVFQDISLSELEGLNQAESWLADCFIDTEMLGRSEQQESCGASDSQNDHEEDCRVQTTSHIIVVQPRSVRATRRIVLKGKKAYNIKTPGKLTSSIAYPFTFIKPCGDNGDVTLRDINQKIHSPPQKVKQPGKEEDNLEAYPTSAFSGKPVVGKTKIRTEGGKGSITIMRTKG